MSPEFGATATLFPIDDETLAYLRLTGRSDARVALVEHYAKTQGLWRVPGADPVFDELLELDLASVVPSVAGPRRPQDRVPLDALRENFRSNFPDGLEDHLPVRQATHSGDAVEEASDASFPASDPTSFSTDDPHAAPAPAVPVGVPDDTREYLPVEVEVPRARRRSAPARWPSRPSRPAPTRPTRP